jgi:hypothetical protein
MMIASFVVTLLLPAVVFTLQGGTGESLPTPTTIQQAEAEGAGFTHEVAPASQPSGFRPGEVKGTDARRCVEFPDSGVLSHISSLENSRRSGEFVVGGEIVEGLKAGVAAKVFWVPLHDPASRKATLLVRSVRLDEPAITSRFVNTDYAFPMKEQRFPIKDSVADREHGFYPSGFSLPTAGRWLLVATSGPDWGCFIVTVR